MVYSTQKVEQRYWLSVVCAHISFFYLFFPPKYVLSLYIKNYLCADLWYQHINKKTKNIFTNSSTAVGQKASEHQSPACSSSFYGSKGHQITPLLITNQREEKTETFKADMFLKWNWQLPMKCETAMKVDFNQVSHIKIWLG